MTHVQAFFAFGFCSVGRDDRDERFVIGQWQEVLPQTHAVDCATCRLMLSVVVANRLDGMFNSDQRALAAFIKAEFKEGA